MKSKLLLAAITALVVSFSPTTAAQLTCGDCNADTVVDVLDAFTAVQHAVLILTLGSPDFDACNVTGDLGGPFAPGNPAVDVLDALVIAQFSVGIVPTLGCVPSPMPWGGPFDVVFTQVPTDTVSDRPFEVEIGLFVQGSPVQAIPTSPLLVRLSIETGSGTLRGSVQQWMNSELQTFGNLLYGPVETFTLRASAGPPNTDDISAPIDNGVQVEVDSNGSAVTTAGPFPTVRFHFRDDGLVTSVSTGTFNWDITDVATMTVIDSGSTSLTGQAGIDVSTSAVGLAGVGTYRVYGEIAGSLANDTYALAVGNTTTVPTRPTLASGRVGIPYDVNIMDYVNHASGGPGYTPMTFGPFVDFTTIPEELPPGLAMVGGPNGNIAGIPTSPGFWEFNAFGRTASGGLTRVSIHIAVFSWRDAEVESGISFRTTGPFPISEFDYPPSGSYSFTNSWDCTTDTTRARFYFPTDAANMGRLPALTWIHGNGFDYDFYDEIYRWVASYGYVIGSVSNPGYPQQGCTFCSTSGSGGPGYSRATGFQDSIIEKFQQLDAGTLSGPAPPPSAAALVGGIDFDNLFYGGHSRGGSTTLVNLMWKPWVVRGAIPSMQVDPKAQSCLGLINFIPARPLLSFSAENDGDVVWPIAEASMEDKTLAGMTTHVTLYGACHGYFTDTANCFGTPTIPRTSVHEAGRHWITAFMNRHTQGDLRVESQLYIDEDMSSTDFGVMGQRDMEDTVFIDDHQATGIGTNQTGGPNSFTGLTATEVKTHPSSPSYGRSILHRRFAFGGGGGTNTWSAPPGSPVDTSESTWLMFRGRQYNSTSSGATGTGDWQSWLSTWDITLEDGVGTLATVNMVPFFPVSGVPSPAQQRWHRFGFLLDDFVQANPAFDPSSIQAVTFAVSPGSPTGSRWVATDDVRFE